MTTTHSQLYSLTEFLGLTFKELVYRRSTEKEKNDCWFIDETELIHRTFEKIKEEYKEKFPILQNLHFATQGLFPYSHELNQALHLLYQSGMLKKRNDENRYAFGPTWFPDSKDVFEKRKNKLFNPEKTRNFEELAGKLAEELEILVA